MARSPRTIACAFRLTTYSTQQAVKRIGLDVRQMGDGFFSPAPAAR